jgi:hypothetical protein
VAQGGGTGDLTEGRGWAHLGGLGLLTIAASAACCYAFGAFIAPFSAATGWPEGTLGVVLPVYSS